MPTDPDRPPSEDGRSTPPEWLTPSGYVDPVERSIRQAVARGEFDHLPGAGKPLPDLDREYDPDWWARRYLEQMRAQDAADDVRRLLRQELPLLKTTPDRAAAAARIAELNALIARVNATVPEELRLPPVAI
ncbi:MAG: DUF1992 domain-containing protein [Acidimicrobiia bacterium]|nr:DUF1992 domain-containing protein [Acidimicrobiia bacterium]